VKIVHIVGPVKVPKNNNLYNAQPITFESMRKAKDYIQNSYLEVILCSTQYDEDKEIIPNYFTQLSDLTRSVNDVNPALKTRKLPLIKDILQKIEEINDIDYVIYTNVDIALMPNFYETVFEYIKLNHDAIIINRRRIANNYNSAEQLPLMFAELGRSHPGFDCFIFKQGLLNKLILDDICVGIPFIEVSLLHNLLAFSDNPLVLFDKHLTFHLGMDVLGYNKNEYYKHNKEVYFKRIYPKIRDKFDLKKFPYAEDSRLKRFLKWGLNPSLMTVDYLSLEGKSYLNRLKLILDELRWRFLQR
jgi:hypothetical protein